jgi:hypothetical protein
VLVLFVVFCTTVGGGTQCDLDLLNLNSSFRGGTQRDLLNSPFIFMLIYLLPTEKDDVVSFTDGNDDNAYCCRATLLLKQQCSPLLLTFEYTKTRTLHKPEIVTKRLEFILLGGM